MPGIVTVTDKDFEDVVLKSTSGKPVLVYFWAPWVGPCREMTGHVEKIAEEHDELVVVRVNADDGQKSIEQCGVRVLPTLVLVREGHHDGAWQGFMTKEMIENKVLA
ncbi:thioredoxin domain-containing protein [Streptomyces sp. NPDC096323]|uniref:thioredoxin family protein n=1 Tax=Streptomyces sp. NPDC096323 TaxID=3155822 RepID=UPI00332DF121